MKRVCLVVLAGCTVHAAARTLPSETESAHIDRHVVVGGPISVELKWPGYDERPFRYEIWCSASCRAEPADGVADGPKRVEIRPLSVGPMEVSVRMTRLDNQQVRRATLARVDVVLPDHLKLACYDARDSCFHDCDGLDLNTSAPWIAVTAYLDNAETERVDSTDLRVNGRAWPWQPAQQPPAAGALSIADLYPGARSTAGDGVQPGTYPIHVEFRGSSHDYTVKVR